MKRQIIAVVTATAMLVALIPTMAFATDDENSENLVIKDRDMSKVHFDYTGELSSTMSEYVQNDEISNDFSIGKNGYSIKGVDVDISIPKMGKDGIAMKSAKEDAIEMYLPETVKAEEGVVTENGTIVYTSQNENSAFGVQALSVNKGKEQ